MARASFSKEKAAVPKIVLGGLWCAGIHLLRLIPLYPSKNRTSLGTFAMSS